MTPPLRVVREGLLPPSSFHHLVQLGHRLVQLSLGRVILCQHVLVFVYNRSSEEPFASDIRSGKSRQRDKKGGRGGRGGAATYVETVPSSSSLVFCRSATLRLSASTSEEACRHTNHTNHIPFEQYQA